MEASFIEEVAASLVREFLSRKGLKKTSTAMEEEFPRTALSINNRNELRNVLHLQALYRENKAKQNPLKSILEIMTNFFLEHTSSSKGCTSVPQNTSLPPRCTESTPVKTSLPEATRGQRIAERSKKEAYRYEIEEETSHPAGLPQRHPHRKSERSTTWPALEGNTPAKGEKKLAGPCEDLQPPELPLETRATMRERLQARPGGLSVGEMGTSHEDSLKRRTLKWPSGIGVAAKPRGEDSTMNSFTVPVDENKGICGQSANICSHSGSSLGKSKDHSPNVLIKTCTDSGVNSSANSKDNSFSKLESEIQHVQQRRPASNYSMERNEKIHHLNTFQRHTAAGSKNRARSPAKGEYQFSDCRKTPISASSRDQLHKDALELVDVEDEEALEEVCQVPKPSLLCILQVTSKPVDFYLARDLKILLFGSSLGCFSEEWKIQSFAFNNNPQLKYGLVQKKGGPCGVLAAVQACVLRHLIFGDSNRNSRAWGTELSEAHRTKCLALALARILWRAGSDERAAIALCAGTQQFTPAGKYKADGILETLKLHFLTTYEDLLMFLQQHIHEFEIGPYGCILLTLSVILSRSIDLVRGDFDVSTNQLIGAHGYCTQELVNLLLTGKAVPNVFNDTMELDAGNGNVTVLKGITSRSEIGLLSLFEHYNVCQICKRSQNSLDNPEVIFKGDLFMSNVIYYFNFLKVGCYLKTPRFPIWLVCSESHFSVLFCLRKDLLGDWKTERRFDLYYYDGLANQQEEIRLTIDSSQAVPEDKESDLTPPLEHCIRTKWTGAVVNWNGTEPIL